jgi:formylglycine-generating enzyme required for sulfatase activity
VWVRDQLEIMGPYLLLESLDAVGPESRRAVTTDEEPPTQVVIRRLPRWMWSKERYEKQVFEAEIELRERGLHPRILRVLDAGEIETIPYIALEYVPGISLQELFAALADRDELLPLDVAVTIFFCVTDAIVHLGASAIARQDSLGIAPWLSPRRVLLPFVAERLPVFLGVSAPPQTFHKNLPRHRVAMSMRYEAPELRQAQPATSASDVFSLGVLLHELLEGRAPFAGDLTSIRAQAADGVQVTFERRSSRKVRPLKVAVQAALSPDPTHRPSTFELYEAARASLQDFGSDETSLADFLAARFSHRITAEEKKAERAVGFAERRQRASRPPRTREHSVVIRLPGFDDRILTRDGREMVEVPAGSFLFGPDLEEQELPAYFIDRFPVTNSDYLRFLEATGRPPPPQLSSGCPAGMEDHPVVGVTSDEAEAFARWAGKRLPSEEEWEKAARGTSGRLWPHGRTFQRDAVSDQWQKSADMRTTVPVGSFSPDGDSPYHVADIGHLWEWTSVPWQEPGERVVRGGPWRNRVEPPLVTNRSWENARSKDVGFRCVVDADALEKIRA